MRSKLQKFASHPLISGSIILSAGSLIANFLNFIFNIIISRNLSVQDYGTVATLVAVITLLGIAAGAIIPTIVSFTTESFSKNDLAHVRGVYFKIAKPYLTISILISGPFIILSGIFSKFLNITNGEILLIITGVIIFFGFLSVINHALFQARLSFIYFSFLSILSAVVKIATGTFFLLSGLKALGVMLAILVAYIIPYVIGFFSLRFLFENKVSNAKISVSDILQYAAPSGIAFLAFTSISSSDLVLVKHLFTPSEAGIYAGLSLIGKVIFFATAPLGMVMFPLIKRKFLNNEKYVNTFLTSLTLVSVASFSITFFYFIFPEFTINLFLKNEEYLRGASILGYFGIFVSLYSLCSIFMYYFLSINKTWVYKPILITAIVQIIGIYLYHKDFSSVIFITIACVFSLFIFLSGSFVGQYKK